MADGGAPLRGGDRPHIVQAHDYTNYKPFRMGGLVPPRWRSSRIGLYDLEHFPLDDVDVLIVPGYHDQIFMKSIEPKLAGYLAAGGNFIVSGHLTLPWLPWLSPFKAVSPKPFTNWMIRPANPGRYFGRMDFENFHRHEGILGQYARGYSDAPPGAQWLCLIGRPGDEGPVDWVWRIPGGGKLFVHNGDNIEWFCSDPRREPNLFHDILNAILFSDEPAAPPAGAGRG